MFQRQAQAQAQRLQQRAEPQLLLTNRLLQMSSLELRQCVLQEVADNPALEAPEGPAALSGGSDTGDGPYVARAASDWRMFRELGSGWAGDGDEETDPLDAAEAPETLRQHLLVQLYATADAAERRVGRYLIDNIDDGGYLRCDAVEAAESLGVAVAAVDRVLELVQGFEPAGVGARSLQECLLIQARGLAAEGQAPPPLERMIALYWKELAAARWGPIARGLGLPTAEVERLAAWLRRNLCPYPGNRFRPRLGRSSARAGHAVGPDVVIRPGEGGELELELVREPALEVRFSLHYARLWQEMRRDPQRFSAVERRHVGDYMARAEMFVKSIRDRTTILRRLCEILLEEQERYLRAEREEDLMPMTQAQLAAFLQVHESTVSRAVAEKFVQLPSGRVVPLNHFFDRSLSLRKLVANLVAAEDPAAPYSDQQISDLLRRQGVVVARRTVMKYREEMNILSSRQRARRTPGYRAA